MQIVHGDLHIWNVLVSRWGLGAIDFEDHLWGWPVQDLGVTLYYLEGHDGYRERLAGIRRGYETVAPWPERYPGEIAAFIAARTLVLANDVILLEREEEPGLDAGAFFARAEARLRRLLPDL